MLRNLPITRKLMAVILVTSGAVLALTCGTFLVYELVTFRQSMVRSLSTLAQAIAANSTAALAFQNVDDAEQVLSAVAADPHVVAAAVYDREGELFASYANPAVEDPLIPGRPDPDGYRFGRASLALYEPVVIGNRRLGTLYLQSDLGAMYQRFTLYASVVFGVITAASLVALVLATRLQRHITQPVLALARTAKTVSDAQDYSTRATRFDNDELGQLTDAFNAMLEKVQERDRALLESRQHYQAMAESLPHLVWTCRPDGYCDFLSRQWIEYTGIPADEQLGFGWAAQLHPDDRDRVQAEWAAVTASGGIYDEGFRIRRADGVYRWFKTRAVPLRDSTGTIVKWFGSNTDFDDYKRSEEHLRAQLGRLNLLDRLTRAIGERLDLQSVLQVVVRSLEEQFPLDFCCVCTYDRAADALIVTRVGIKSQALAQELALPEKARIPVERNGLYRSVSGELVYEPDVAQDASPFAQRLARSGLRAVVAAPLVVESTVFGVVIAARRDAPGFSSAECEFLRQLSQHVALAAHQAELYTALQRAYDDLRQTQLAVMQQERLKALGQMASGIAHDINNAVSPVALYTESLLENEPNLSAQAREYLSIIQRAVDDVAQTVARMREFYRGREPQLTLSAVHVNRLVREVVELTRARWNDMPQQRGVMIEVSTELTPENPAVLGVESEIREALINLVFNAVDAMPEGGRLTLRTRTRREKSPGAGVAGPETVHVEVSDTGFGMDPDTRRRCMEPFFTTKGERGTGLGLAMVYGIVQRHSADVEVDTAPGEGTTFRMIFAAPAGEVGVPVAARDRLRPQRLRILIVDDDPLLLKSLADVLERDGHVVVAANGGEAGIDTFNASHRGGKPFGAVITDLGMPYVDGHRVASAIRETDSSIPVILLTGWGQRLGGDTELPPHVDRVLSKPPKLTDLRRALSDLTATRT